MLTLLGFVILVGIVVNRMHVNFGRAHELLARGYIVAEMTGVV